MGVLGTSGEQLVGRDGPLIFLGRLFQVLLEHAPEVNQLRTQHVPKT